MICILLLSALATPQKPLFPADAPYKDRAGFYRAVEKVHSGMSKAQVKKLLGTPDDIKRGRPELGGYNADEIWRYGTDKHLGVPTLGEVCILKGKVFWRTGNGDWKGFKQVIPEPELRKILRKLYVNEEQPRYDPLWMVQAANALIDLGKPKAVFALEQFEGLHISGTDLDAMEDLLRLVFEVPSPPGYPRHNAMWTTKQLLPKFRKGPRFPLIVMDDVPFLMLLGASGGTGARYGFDLGHYRKHPMRTKRLHPPDDPFQTYQALLKSDQWPYPARSKGEARFAIRYEEDEGEALQQVLILVRDAYQPVDFRSHFGVNGLALDTYYKGFKKLNARWDDGLQRYVRGDGARLAQKKQPPTRHWFPLSHNNMKIEVSLSRNGDSDYVNGGYSADDLSGGPFEPEVLRVVDASSEKLIYWMAVGPRVNRDDSMGDDAKSEAKYLTGKATKRPRGSMGMTVGLTIPVGKAVRVELVTRKRRIVGPILRP